MICTECANDKHKKCKGCPCQHKSETRVDETKIKT